MAARKAAARVCYVYAIMQGDIVAYVGKGAGRRGQQSARRVGGALKIIKDGLTDDEAFLLERQMIAELAPTENVSAGGNGGRVRRKVVRKPKSVREFERELEEIERIGPRIYAARFLLTRLDEANCETYGVSKVGLSRLRQVAHG
jgi:hypothetical protein